MTEETFTLIVAILAGAVRAGTSVMYAVLGEILTERSGILNLGLEGIMLLGALASVIVSYHTGSPILGICSAFLIGGLLGLIHAFLSVKAAVNQIACGIAITMLAMGLSAFWGIEYVGKKIDALGSLEIPLLSDIPILGTVIFSQDILVYLLFLLVPAMALFFKRTKAGLEVSACGEDPNAAASAGIKVELIRLLSTSIGSGLAAIGGAHLALFYTKGWIENMTVGRGWMAIGLVIFSFWSPSRAVPGVLIFGGAISLQLGLQAVGISVSQYLMGMVPYVFVLIALVFATRRLQGNSVGLPISLGKKYIRQQ